MTLFGIHCSNAYPVLSGDQLQDPTKPTFPFAGFCLCLQICWWMVEMALYWCNSKAASKWFFNSAWGSCLYCRLEITDYFCHSCMCYLLTLNSCLSYMDLSLPASQTTKPNTSQPHPRQTKPAHPHPTTPQTLSNKRTIAHKVKLMQHPRD